MLERLTGFAARRIDSRSTSGLFSIWLNSGLRSRTWMQNNVSTVANTKPYTSKPSSHACDFQYQICCCTISATLTNKYLQLRV